MSIIRDSYKLSVNIKHPAFRGSNNNNNNADSRLVQITVQSLQIQHYADRF
jgi:hypothetical protein